MKRILLSAVALALVAGTAATAQPYGDRQDIRQDRHDIRQDQRDIRGDRRDIRQDRGFHHYGRGERLDTRYGAYSEVGDWRGHRLNAPPRGYHWVRHNNDYVLAALGTGLIASVIANANY